MNVLASFFHRSQLNADIEEEQRAHIQLRADDLERSGLTRAEAERRAHIEFGARVRISEECHDAFGSRFFEILFQDLRYVLRLLRKSPGFAIAAVITLSLAIGANAVVFGILDGLILRTLQVPQVESLLGTNYGDGSGFQAYPNYVDLRDRNHSFEEMAAFNMVFVGLDRGNDPSAATGFAASGNYFDVLRLHPYLGRFFHASDERGINSAPYLVLTYAYWKSHFQGDPAVIGRVVQLDKHPYTILGVAPPGFQGTLLFLSPDFFMPIINQEQVAPEGGLSARGSIHALFETFGRLKPGVTAAQATADVNAIGEGLAKTYPKEVSHKIVSLSRPGLTGFGGPVRALRRGLDGAFRIDSAGCMREPGKPVRGPCCRSFPRTGAAARARFQPPAHPAAIVHRSYGYFVSRRNSGVAGWSGFVAPAEYLATVCRGRAAFPR